MPFHGPESRNDRLDLGVEQTGRGVAAKIKGCQPLHSPNFTHSKSKSQQRSSVGWAEATVHLPATGGRKGTSWVFRAQAAGLSTLARLYTMV